MKKTIAFLVLLFLLTPFVVGASFNKSLYYGLQKDAQVKELQEFLTDQGFYTGPITGNYFSLTLSAVKKFQSAHALSSSGYFGPLSRERANSILKDATTEASQEAIQGSNPASEKSSGNNDVILTLQAQIALLQKQLDALRTQNQATQQSNQQLQQSIEQIQQNTQEIAQNTTSTPIIKDKKYDNFTYSVIPNIAPVNSNVSLTLKMLNSSGEPLSGIEATFRYYHCKCDDPVQTDKGYAWTLKSDENGEIDTDVSITKFMNNFVSVQIIKPEAQPIQWIAIPTLSDSKIWNWNEKDGGYFSPT